VSEPAHFTSEENAAYQRLLHTANAVPRHQQSPWKWVQLCQEGPPHVVAAVLMDLAGPATAAQHEAMRDAAQLVIAAQLTDRIVTTMERLDAAASRLAKVGLAVAIVGAIATVVGAAAALWMMARGAA
jgi:hypothetical protein